MPELTTIPKDASEREAALNPHISYAVSAPAGSGKTELLIQRTLKLLSLVDQPENILAITFTRKAANEMRERIVHALDDAKNNKPLESEHQKKTRELALAVLDRNRQQGWELLENPSRLRLQTIDSLCRQLANQLCLETGLSVPPNMSEDVSALYQQAAEQTLSYLSEDSVSGELLRKLLLHLDGDMEKLCSLIADLLSSRDSWLQLVFSGAINNDYLEERTTALIEESLEKNYHLLSPYISDINGLLDYACAHKQGADYLHPSLPMEVPEPDAFVLSEWKAIRAFFLSGAGDKANYRSMRGLNKRMGFPTESDQVDKHTAKQRKQEFAELTSVFQETPEIAKQLNRIAILPDLFDVEHSEPNAENINSETDEQRSEEITQALFSLLPRAAAEFELLSQSQGETDFTAVSIAALRALGSPEQPTPLALRMDYRIQHILVDEFQDTSSMQINLLECLTAGWEPEDGRTLFIVGDGMQSIYSFRKANVSLFIRARQQGIGMVPIEPLNLSSNFRSEKQIVDWVNQSFSKLFPSTDNLVQGQVAFREAQPIKKGSDSPIHMQAFANAELEAEAIATNIEKQLLESQQSSKPSDIAILVRGRSHLKTILPALRARSIQWQAKDIDPLNQRMAVMDIHSLLRALCIPADNLAWLAVLRAPWIALDMKELLTLHQFQKTTNEPIGNKTKDTTKSTTKETAKEQSENQKAAKPSQFEHRTIWSKLKNLQLLSADLNLFNSSTQNNLDRLVSAFSVAMKADQPLRQTIEQLWNQLDGADCLLEQRDLQDIEDYLKLVEKMDSGGQIIDWPAFERQLEQLYSLPEEQTTQQEKFTSSVQIMTIHKSKGLEFDHVYLPALGKVTGINDEPLMLWWQREYEDGSEGYLLATKPNAKDRERNKKNKKQSLYDYLREDEKERQKQETARLLYVACTRAKKSLFLTASLKWDEKKEQVSPPSSSTLLAALWSLYSENFSASYVPVEELTNKRKEARVLTGIRRLRRTKASPSIANATENSLTQKLAQNENDELENYTEYSDNYIARKTGDLIHHSLMRIVQERIQSPCVEEFYPEWQNGLASLGLNPEQEKTQLTRIASIVNTMLVDELGRWILKPDHQESMAELTIDYLDKQGSISQAIVDRTFIAPDFSPSITPKTGSTNNEQDLETTYRWIIDYKSSQPKVDESLDDFLKRESKTYQSQLNHYVKIFRKMECLPIKTMLYFPSIAASIMLKL